MSKLSSKNLEKEQLLAHFTLENLQEAVFWVQSDQQILNVNEAACQMTGYKKEELLEKKVTEINPTALLMDFPAFWKRLKKEKKSPGILSTNTKPVMFTMLKLRATLLNIKAKNIHAVL